MGLMNTEFWPADLFASLGMFFLLDVSISLKGKKTFNI